MKQTEPPLDFEHYIQWRRTLEGIAWFRQACSVDYYRFVCNEPKCGTVVWWPKGNPKLPPLVPQAEVRTIPCVYPCAGMLVKQREPEFWEER